MKTRLLLTVLLALALASAAAMAARPVEPLRGCAPQATSAPVHTALEIAPAESMAFLRARHRGAVP